VRSIALPKLSLSGEVFPASRVPVGEQVDRRTHDDVEQQKAHDQSG
jgi:hypothetical protein